ncbi:MAG: hypothetical protein UGF89_05115 [Acutalibacteraceae bacterium]|nr:hypothetical protein [Acutalibacteraceae bacterium]
MKTMKKTLSVFFAVLCLLSALSVTTFAATKYKSYDGKYGLMIPVKSNYKTQCKSYSVDGTSGSLTFKFDSKGKKDNVYYGFTIYSDAKRQNIIINKSGVFPTVDSKGKLSIDFSKLESGTYYGLTFTYIQKGKDLIIDKDSIYQFDIKLNKIANVTPKIAEAQALYSGNYIKWKKVTYADFYRVYRKQEGSSFEKLADVTKLEYTDKTAIRGEKYIYTIRAFDEDCYSKRNKNGVDLVYLAPPKFKDLPETLEDNKIKFSWEAVKGAKKYRVYRKTADAKKYTRLATVSADVLEYTDKTSKVDGETYYYAVKAVNGTNAGVLSNKYAITLFGVKKPIAYCVGETATIKWDTVENATDYKLFKKNSDGQWDLLYSGTEVQEIVDENVSIGNKYIYSLVIEKDGQYSSFDTKGVTAYCLSEPKITSIKSSTDNSVYIKWGSVEGATKYNIYRESPFEDYKLIGTTSKTSFYDKTQKDSNYFYTYYVEAANEYGVGISGNNMHMHLFMKAPQLVSVKWDSGNVVKWKRVPGATSYVIMRRTPSGEYKKIAEVKDVLSYKDKSAKKKSKYYYTVAAMNGKYQGSYESGIRVN